MAVGVYSAEYTLAALAAAKTLMYQTAPADAVCEIMSAHVTNATNETNEQFEVKFHRIATLGTPTGTAVVPGPHHSGSTATGVTMKANITASEPTYGAVNVNEFGLQGAATLGGWHFEPPPDERPANSPAGNIGLRHMASVTAFDAKIVWVLNELGG